MTDQDLENIVNDINKEMEMKRTKPKINFPKSKKVGRIDLGGVIITDNSTILSSSPKLPTKKGIERLVAAMSEGIFATNIEKYDKTLVAQNEVLAELNAIIDSSYAEMLGTYDYDRIAEGVLELVEKYKEGEEDTNEKYNTW